MTLLNRKSFIFLFFFIIILPLKAGVGISLSTTIDKTKGYIGDEFHYTITIVSPKSYFLFPPNLGDNLGSFQIRDFQQSEKNINKSSIEKKYNFTLSAYMTGAFTIPVFSIYYKDKTGQTNHLQTDKINVEILKMTSSQMTNKDIKDIKAQFKMKDNLLWLKILVGVLLLFFTIALIYIKKFKKKSNFIENIIKKEPQLPPDEEARQKLQEIKDSDLLNEGFFKEYYSLVNEVIRTYIFRRFNVATLEASSYDILQELEKIYLSQEIFKLVETFLEKSDMVKFAKYKPSGNEVMGFIESAFDIVLLTTEKKEEETEDSEDEK